MLARMKGSHRRCRWEFLEQHTTEERLMLALCIKRRQPTNVPLVLGRAGQCRVGTHHELRVSVPGHLNLAQLHLALRTRMEVHPSHSIIYFIENNLAPLTCCLSILHQQHAHTDSFLYITFCEENVQG